MIPAFCRVKHDPEAGQYGDCVRACIASILELDTEAVPHFFDHGPDGPRGLARVREWLKGYQLAPFLIHYPGEFTLADIQAMIKDQNPTVPYMLFGRTETGGHVVVGRDDRIAHDPAWYSSPLIGPGDHGHWTVMVLARL